MVMRSSSLADKLLKALLVDKTFFSTSKVVLMQKRLMATNILLCCIKVT